ELFNQMLRNRGLGGPASPGEENEPAHRSMPKNMQEAFFVQVEVDKTDVYEGEQLTVNWYVYTRGQMETLDRLKFPALRGFWKEIIEEVPALVFQEEIINGVPWRKALLASHALFPIKAGQSYIDEFKIKSRVRLPVAGWGFGLGKAYEYTKSSERVKINVKPLPTAGRPSDFSGAVGRFEINAAVEGNTFPLNQPFTMKLRFEGEGNAKLIELPPIQWPDGLELYETKSDSKFFRDGRSFKEFTLLIIPRKQGDHVIPEIGLSMFDPNKGIYTRKTSKPINIHVGPALSSSETPSQRRSSVQEKSSAQIALPQPVASAEPTLAAHILSVPWAGGFFWIFGLLLVFAKAVFEFGWWRKKMTLRTQMRERLKRVENFAASSDVRRTGAEAVNALYLLLGRLGGKGGAEREFGKLLEALPPSILKAHGQKLSLAFEKFQTLGFAPEELVREWVQGDRLRTEVKDLINLVDKVLDSAAEENASEH
ncbi:MAG: BatD family protein, partial [Bdellovibrionaceae bacterium]|nr:BatD family protein [Pseudobdellovibrionaceae bacterium]